MGVRAVHPAVLGLVREQLVGRRVLAAVVRLPLLPAPALNTMSRVEPCACSQAAAYWASAAVEGAGVRAAIEADLGVRPGVGVDLRDAVRLLLRLLVHLLVRLQGRLLGRTGPERGLIG
jgi:hypothetical protein